MYPINQKRVRFSETVTYYETYSSLPSSEFYYDRGMIDHVLYRKAYNMLSQKEYFMLLQELNQFKQNEMIVHENSVNNLHFK